MSNWTTWIPSVIAAIVALVGAFGVPDMIAENPAVSAILAGVGAIIAALSRSPLQK